MRILILGGTVFLGRHLVEAALARGHEVTLFNRGQHGAELYPEVERLRGDRDGGLDVLRGRRWDAAIDTSGYLPRLVGASVGLLADAVNHYSFISSISVFSDVSAPRDESGPLAMLADPDTEPMTNETYGGLKALCEQAAEAAMPGRVLTIRPGLIVGPFDPSGRFAYWPTRVARGGDVLAPDHAERPVQLIDARDLAEWNIRMTEAGNTGIYNATGPDFVLSMGAVLDACKNVSRSDARFIWVDERFLLEQGVGPWMELPLWIPNKPENAGFMATDCRKAFATGLTFRPIDDTVRDTLAWASKAAQIGGAAEAARPPAGLAPEREVAVLKAWHDRVPSRSVAEAER